MVLMITKLSQVMLLAGLMATPVWAESRFAYVPYNADTDDARDTRVVTEKGEKEGLVARVKGGNNPSLSPDGKKLLITLFLKDGRRLAVVDLATGKQRQLPVEGREVYGGSWSPDGSRIAFHHLGGKRWKVGVSKPDGSEFQVLGGQLPEDEDLFLAGWNLKTGEPLAHDMKSLFQLKWDGDVAWSKKLEELFAQPYAASDCQFWVAPDGTTVYGNFEVMEDEIKNIQGPSNYLVQADLNKGSASAKRITPKGLHVGQPVLSLDGQSVIFTGFTSDDIKLGKEDQVDMTMRIYRLKVEDQSIAPLFENAWFPTMSR
jgi:dipeptidyl aminopeptidase/acylaminoacyl peptidase